MTDKKEQDTPLGCPEPGVLSTPETPEEMEALQKEAKALQDEIDKQREKLTDQVRADALNQIAEMTLEDLPPEVRDKYDKLHSDKKIKEVSLPQPPKLNSYVEIIDVSSDNENFQKLLNSGIMNVYQSEPHWTKDDRCLVYFSWTAPDTWEDPRS